MYGGLCALRRTILQSLLSVCQDQPSPLSKDFDWEYFPRLLSSPEVPKLSAKAFLATEQRIPGLGNGVLQDILWTAHIHPKAKMGLLSDGNKECLFIQIKDVLAEMAALGGRDTEKDLLGSPGGYKTAMSKNNAGLPCRFAVN
jgi:formamidopyrimidine-DNA glycosylase